ncbi:MAG: T9SS type A sorting domain-containing protein [Bacteroidetes bacterium]|nr:T9SS type A sorting domain-containing protein [Bacteroidota bacterium]
MKKTLTVLTILITLNFSLTNNKCYAQVCSPGGCAATATNSTGQYPSTTFSTSYSSWSTISAYMNAGNYTLFHVVNGNTYEWSYCSDFGGSQGWDAELTLFNNSTGATLCYQNNCGRPNCASAPYIRWTATFTGTVKLLTTLSGCNINTGSPYSTLVWRDTSGTPLIQILGVDVYSGYGSINWSQVAGAGYTFAYAKATEGVGYTDSWYLNYAVNGPLAGLKMGAYHFARPDLNPSLAGAVSEANYFLSVAQPYITTCQLPPSLDLEGSYLQSNFTSAQLTAWVQTWMNTVQTATGIKPVLYIGASTANYLNSSVNTYSLWTDYLSGSSTTAPPNIGVWNTWTFNQYSWTATVPGISGAMDVNVFNGNAAAFNNFMGCITTGNMEQARLNNSFNVYPNPASTEFHIDYSGINGQANVNVYDISGKLLMSHEMIGKTIINTSNLSEGVYNVSIKNREGVVNKRLIVTHE